MSSRYPGRLIEVAVLHLQNSKYRPRLELIVGPKHPDMLTSVSHFGPVLKGQGEDMRKFFSLST